MPPSFSSLNSLPSSTKTSLLTLTKRTLIGIDIFVLVIPSIIFAIWSSILLYDTIKIDNTLLWRNSTSTATNQSLSDPFTIIINNTTNNSTLFSNDIGSYVPLIFQCLTFSILFGLTMADWLNVLFVSFGGEICERIALWRWKQKKMKENPSLVFSGEGTSERAEMEDAATDANIPPINEHWIDEDDSCEMAQTTCLAHGGFIIVKWLIMGGIILGLFSWFTYELLATNDRLKGAGNNILTTPDTPRRNDTMNGPAVGFLSLPTSYVQTFATAANNSSLNSNTTMDACATLFFTPVGSKSGGSTFMMQRSKISSFGDSVFIYMLVRWLLFGLSVIISISISIIIACFGCCTCFSEKNKKRKSSHRGMVGENVIYRPLSTLSDDEEDD